jgi:hypothetical protein
MEHHGTLARGWGMATLNMRDFERVPDLIVVDPIGVWRSKWRPPRAECDG